MIEVLYKCVVALAVHIYPSIRRPGNVWCHLTQVQLLSLATVSLPEGNSDCSKVYHRGQRRKRKRLTAKPFGMFYANLHFGR